MKRIRQGHTRWRVYIEYDKLTGRPAIAWAEACLALKVGNGYVRYLVGGCTRMISDEGWMRLQPTYRKAWRAVHEIIDQANREIHREYSGAWLLSEKD